MKGHSLPGPNQRKSPATQKKTYKDLTDKELTDAIKRNMTKDIFSVPELVIAQDSVTSGVDEHRRRFEASIKEKKKPTPAKQVTREGPKQPIFTDPNPPKAKPTPRELKEKYKVKKTPKKAPEKQASPAKQNKEVVSKTSPGPGWTKTKGTNIWAPPKGKMMMKEARMLKPLPKSRMMKKELRPIKRLTKNQSMVSRQQRKEESPAKHSPVVPHKHPHGTSPRPRPRPEPRPRPRPKPTRK